MQRDHATPILADDTSSAGASPRSPCRSPTAPSWSTRTSRTCSRACPAGQGPAQVAARRGGADARARPGRGDRGRDGQRHQLQHRVDLDLRAGLHVRVPRALRPDHRPRQAPRPALPRGRLRPGRRRAARPAPACTRGSPATRSSRTASRSSWRSRRPRRHDARPRSSASGASRPTSAASRPGAGQDQPADAQARAPHLGGGRLPGPGQLHRLPPAGQQATAPA